MLVRAEAQLAKKGLLEIVVNLLIVSPSTYEDIAYLSDRNSKSLDRKMYNMQQFGQEENVSGGHVRN